MSLISTRLAAPAALALALFAASPTLAAPAPETFAPLAEKVTPAVVNISSVHQTHGGMPGGLQSMTGSSRIASYFSQAARAVAVSGGSFAQSGGWAATGSQTRKRPSPRSAAARSGSIVACR